MGEPVCRVSDEGGFGRARPLGRAQPDSRVSGKTDRSRGVDTKAKSDKILVNKGRFEISTPSSCVEGCVETLTGVSDSRIFLKEGSNFGQKTPPVRFVAFKEFVRASRQLRP
jgi:hypothetical protein